MQRRHKQLNSQNQTQNYYNKLNYHLKKTQPFKNKVKRTVTQQMRAYAKQQKVSTITNNIKYIIKPNKQIKQEEEPQSINQQHFNENIANVSSQVKIYQMPGSVRKNIFDRGNSDSRLKKLDIAERGKSLKYWKVQRPEPKFVTHIKGFFNTFLSDDEGCRCGAYCECKQTLLKWIAVSDELIQKNYSRLLSLVYPNQDDKSWRNGDTQYSNYGQNYQSQEQKQQRSKHQAQIQKDIVRTQTQCLLFHRKSIQQKMERVLMCYTFEDPEVGYVQSMNIVMSGVLYHVRDEAKTYAICRKLFHEIRRIYLLDIDFKQCYRHVDCIIQLLKGYALDLYKHLEEVGVQMRVVLFPWVLSLLCVVVPLDFLHLIYIGFVKQGWKFIYKTILSVFIYHKDKLKNMDESGDILVFLSVSNEEKESIDWEDIVRFANHLKINMDNN